MSYQATGWLLEFSKSEHGERLVLHSVAYHLLMLPQKTYIPLDVFEKECRMARSTIIEAIDRLENFYPKGELQELQVVRGEVGSRQCNEYQMPRFEAWWAGAKKLVVPPTGPESGPVQVQKTRPQVQNLDPNSTNGKSTVSKSTEEESTSKETLPYKKKSPKETYSLAKRLYHRFCSGNLGNLNPREQEAWEAFINQYGEEKGLGAFELWARGLRKSSFKPDRPMSLFLKNSEGYVEDFEIQSEPVAPEDEEEDDMPTAADIRRERQGK